MTEGGSEGMAPGASGVPDDAGVAEGDSQQGMPAPEAGGSLPAEKPITPADFKKFQSEADKRFAAAQKEVEQHKGGLMAAMQYIAQLEAANDQLQMAGSPPEVLQARERERALSLEKMQLEMQKQAMLPSLRQARLLEISQKYEVPMEEIQEAQTYREAEVIAQAYRKYTRREKLDERAKKGTDKQEGASPSAAVDISGIKDPTKLFDMYFKGKKR